MRSYSIFCNGVLQTLRINSKAHVLVACGGYSSKIYSHLVVKAIANDSHHLTLITPFGNLLDECNVILQDTTPIRIKVIPHQSSFTLICCDFFL